MAYGSVRQEVSPLSEIRSEVLKNVLLGGYAEYKEPPPLDDARPNETSWTYMKKQIDAKRSQDN